MTTSPLAVRLTFLALVGLVFLWVAWESGGFPDRARIFPQTIAVLGCIIVVTKIVLLLKTDDQDLDVIAAEERDPGSVTGIGEEWLRSLPFLGVFGGYGVAIALLGFLPASFLFVLFFLRSFDRMGWIKALASAASFTLILLFITHLIGLELPAGLLGITV